MQTSLANTPTAGKDEVLTTLKYLSRGPLGREGASLKQVTLNLQQNGHYGLHAQTLTTFQATVLTVLNALIALNYVTTTTTASGHGEGATTGYKLTRAGVLPSRRTRPQFIKRP